MKRHATAVWSGTLKEGSGHLTTQSKTLSQTQYSFKSRFDEGVGTNPEELIAAAHAGCFTMKLSAELTKAGYNPAELTTTAVVTLDPAAGQLTKSELTLNASVPGISEEEFQNLADIAKKDCPISKALNMEITLNAILQA